MTDTNQKLREAIKRLLKAHRITVQAPPKTITDAENQIAEIQNAVKFAEQALALPTADHLPNAGKMTNGLTQSETNASASVSGPTAAPLSHKPGCPADGGYGNGPEPCICGAAPVGEREATSDLPAGFVPLQKENGRLVYAACFDGGRFHGWLMWNHPDGKWVSKRKLESWEIMQAEDQDHYRIVQEAGKESP